MFNNRNMKIGERKRNELSKSKISISLYFRNKNWKEYSDWN